jgi:hypothetical protein
MFTFPISFWGSASFAPPSIPGLQLWLDASNTGSITLNGSNVSQWSDLSGNSNNATQSSGSLQPGYPSANTQNGLNGVQFPGWIVGSSVQLNIPLITNATENVSIFCVARISGTTDGALIKIGDGSTGYGIGIGNSEYDNFGTNVVALYEGVSWLASGVAAPTDNAFTCGLLIDQNGYPTITLEGTSIFSSSVTPHAPANYAGVGGYGQGQAPSRSFGGTIYELLVYDSLLDSTQQAEIQSYFQTKWATG